MDFSARAGQIFFIGTGVVVLAVVLVVVIAGFVNGNIGPSSSSASPTTAASLTASGLPASVAVGDTSYLSVHIKNTGTADLPHALLDLSGLKDHWVLDGISGSPTVAGDYYDYGSLPADGTLHLSLSVTAKDAGNHDADITLWSDQDSNGYPTGNEPLKAVTKSVAVNP